MTLLTYKAEMEGISVEKVSEQNTSKSCSCCVGNSEKQTVSNKGLSVRDECEAVANADVNRIENIRHKVTPSLSTG